MSDLQDLWSIRPDTTYLNHGSFGLTALPVRQQHARWQQMLADQPMDFFVRRYEPAWLAARAELAQFVGAAEADLTLVENATLAMNIVAQSFPLAADDEVLLTDHEYGAVVRTWERKCRAHGAHCRTATVPWPLHDAEEVVDAVMCATSEKTRLIVISHITSPSALVLPVERVVEAAKLRGIAVCVDGPHAVAHRPLHLTQLGCDFYTASCHKWLCAPLGSGFLYVAPRWQSLVQPLMTSWGRLPPREPHEWWEHFVWRGTRDATALLSIPAAIRFLRDTAGLDSFRECTHELARYARGKVLDLVGTTPWTEDSKQWYGSMVSIPLPPGDAADLQNRLWHNHGIEVPIVSFLGERSIRVSCHLYNTRSHIDRLVDALQRELAAEPAMHWQEHRLPAGG